MNTKLATSRMRTGQWADIIKDCKESGLKVDDYCAQHGLSRNAYFYWLRKVKEAALTQSGFVEVRQQVEFSSCYSSPKLTASVNEVVLGIDENTVYSCGNVPSFRRNGYRCSGRSIPSDRNRIPPASFWLVRVYSLNAGSSPYTSLMDL